MSDKEGSSAVLNVRSKPRSKKENYKISNIQTMKHMLHILYLPCIKITVKNTTHKTIKCLEVLMQNTIKLQYLQTAIIISI